MGGRIWGEPRDGGGSRFIFYVKLFCADAPESAGDEVYGVDSVTEEFAGKRILIAEDMEINREILITLLEGTGLAIDCAENGREAYDMITGGHAEYDMVFMDLQMPELDGLEVTRRVRAFETDRRLPIVAMTANVYQADIESCIDAGMDGHVGKPLEMEEVYKALREHLLE